MSSKTVLMVSENDVSGRLDNGYSKKNWIDYVRENSDMKALEAKNFVETALYNNYMNYIRKINDTRSIEQMKSPKNGCDHKKGLKN